MDLKKILCMFRNQYTIIMLHLYVCEKIKNKQKILIVLVQLYRDTTEEVNGF